MDSVELNAKRALEEKVLLALISAYSVITDLEISPEQVDEKAEEFLRDLDLSNEEMKFAKKVIKQFSQHEVENVEQR